MPARSTALLIPACVAFLCVCGAQLPGADEPARKEGAAKGPEVMEIQLADGGVLKVTLRDKYVELDTAYGHLRVPVGDIQRLELAPRLSPELRRQVDAAVSALGSSDERKRKDAEEELLRLREKAYPALVRLSKSKDENLAIRAADLVEKIRDVVPARQLNTREEDIVHTESSVLVGKVVSAELHIDSFAFGEQRLRLTDVREVRLPGAGPDPADAQPGPAELTAFQNQVGKTFVFQVTGAQQNAGAPGVILGGPFGGRGRGIILAQQAIWGTDIYTLDSHLALAAVHAGVLQPGQTGVVRVKILGQQQVFQSSTRHGVTSMDFGPYPGGYKFVR
jgi:hypothetical protein